MSQQNQNEQDNSAQVQNESLWQKTSQQFNELDKHLSPRKREVRTFEWVLYALIIIVAIVAISIVHYKLLLILVGLAIVWNIVAALAFDKPKMVKIPNYNLNNFWDVFHFSAKSNRVLFLAIPFFILALSVPAYGNPFFALAITFAILWPIRTLLQYSKWPDERKFDKDYVAFSAACVTGLVCMVLSFPTFRDMIETKVINTVENNKNNKNNQENINSENRENAVVNNKENDTSGNQNNASENQNDPKTNNDKNKEHTSKNQEWEKFQNVILQKLIAIEGKVASLNNVSSDGNSPQNQETQKNGNKKEKTRKNKLMNSKNNLRHIQK